MMSLFSLRVAFLLLLLFFAVSVLVEVCRVYRMIQIGRIVAAQAKPFERFLPDAPFRILVVGDSTAVGTGSSDPRDSVAGRLGALFPKASIENRGVNGALTGEIAAQVPLQVIQKYNLVIVQSGGNDILRFTALGKLQRDIEQLLDRALEVGDRVFLLTAGDIGRAPFFPYPLSVLFTRRTRLVRTVFQDRARAKGAQYVDLFIPQVDDVFARDPRRYYASDFLHPSGEGYRVWFEGVQKALHSSP